MRPLRIFLADDHALIRVGLRKILESQRDWQVVGEAGDGRACVDEVLRLRPDVAVVDVSLPRLNGIDATARITAEAPDVRVLIVSMHLNEVYVTRALDAGARGYLLKDSVDADVIAGVAAVAAGRSFFSPTITKLLQDAPDGCGSDSDQVGRYASLSAREREVFQLIAEGHSNKEIASLLSLGVTTVETHRAHILQKLDVHSTRELVLYAVRCGIIS